MGEVVEFFLRVTGTDDAADNVQTVGDVAGITAEEMERLTKEVREAGDAVIGLGGAGKEAADGLDRQQLISVCEACPVDAITVYENGTQIAPQGA